MVSDEQVRHELIRIYSIYIQDKDNKENKKKAFEIYTKYFNGANTLFRESVSGAIWSSFDLSEGKLSEEKANKILTELKKD